MAWKECFTLLEKTLADGARFGRKVYVVCGIQGAGKSTWVQENGPNLAPCVFFDAALPRVVHRAPVIAIARSANAEAYAVWIKITLENALARNAARRDDEQVPIAAIRSVAAQFEPPSIAEGFQEVLVVDPT